MTRSKAALAVAAILLVIAAGWLFPLAGWLRAFTHWVQGAGWPGIVAFALLYVLVTALGLPALPLTLGAGVVYGPLGGTLLVSPASVLGASLAFLLGRTLLRGWVRTRTEGNATFQALDQAIGREGWRLVALLRLSPVFPFSLLNYGLGATGIGFGSYVLASWLAMLPGTFLYVSAGAAAGAATGLSAKPGVPAWMLYLGLAATVLVTLRITLIARRALARALPGPDESRSLPEESHEL
jgi:uncharacterized membrane protein YdjX (TVP38/TMEM64 family)